MKELKLLLKKLLIFGFRSFGLLQLLQQIPQSSEKVRAPVSCSSSAGFVFPFWSFAVLCVFEDLIYVWSSNFFSGLGFVCLFVLWGMEGRLEM